MYFNATYLNSPYSSSVILENLVWPFGNALSAKPHTLDMSALRDATRPYWLGRRSGSRLRNQGNLMTSGQLKQDIHGEGMTM